MVYAYPPRNGIEKNLGKVFVGTIHSVAL